MPSHIQSLNCSQHEAQEVFPISTHARDKYEVVANVTGVTPPEQPYVRKKQGWQFWKRSQNSPREGHRECTFQAVGSNNSAKFQLTWKLDQSEVWKPITLRGPVLGSFIIFSVLVISLLEVLSSKSSGNENGGGLVFAADVDNLPTLPSFGYSPFPFFAILGLTCLTRYLYFPTIIAVCYSLMWG